MPKPARVLLKNISATAFSQLTAIAAQIISVPLFLLSWDTEKYGLWLIILSIPIYIGILELGFGAASCTQLAIYIENQKKAESLDIFIGAFSLLSAVSLISTCLGLCGLYLLRDHFPANALQPAALLIVCGGISIIMPLYEGVLRATNRFHESTTIMAVNRLIETLAAAAIATSTDNFTAPAGAILITRALTLVYLRKQCALKKHGLNETFRYQHISKLREVAHPAFGYALFPAASALAIQTTTLIVASEISLTAAAIYNTYRTISRVLIQATGVVSQAIMPTFTAQWAQGRLQKIRQTLKITQIVSLGIVVLAGPILYISSEIILKVWTHGKIQADESVLISSLAYALCATAWHTSRTALIAFNKHTHLGVASLAITAATSTTLLATATTGSISNIFYTLAFGELLTFLFARKQISNALQPR